MPTQTSNSNGTKPKPRIVTTSLVLEELEAMKKELRAHFVETHNLLHSLLGPTRIREENNPHSIGALRVTWHELSSLREAKAWRVILVASFARRLGLPVSALVLQPTGLESLGAHVAIKI